MVKSTMSIESLVLRFRSAARAAAAASAPAAAASAGAGAATGEASAGADEAATAAGGAPTAAAGKQKAVTCGVCKQSGHIRSNKRLCPGKPMG